MNRPIKPQFHVRPDDVAKLIVPDFLKHLPIDPEWGLPIPYSVSVVDGVAQFKTPNIQHIRHIVEDKLCSVCGRTLGSLAWFIGNPKVALADIGLIVEPPMHRPCTVFAIETCPALQRAKHRDALLITSSEGRKIERLPAEQGAVGIRPVRRADYCWHGLGITIRRWAGPVRVIREVENETSSRTKAGSA